MEYVCLVISILAIISISYTSIKEIKRLEKSIWIKEGIVQEKSKHEKYLQEVIDVLIKENRQLKYRNGKLKVENYDSNKFSK